MKSSKMQFTREDKICLENCCGIEFPGSNSGCKPSSNYISAASILSSIMPMQDPTDFPIAMASASFALAPS